jgi:hypothetical protein
VPSDLSFKALREAHTSLHVLGLGSTVLPMILRDVRQ